MFDLTGKVALVTGLLAGGSARQWRAVWRKPGRDVAVNYTSEHSLEKAEKVAEYIRAKGPPRHPHPRRRQQGRRRHPYDRNCR